MNGIFVTLVVLIVIASVLLSIVILLQSGKGEGLASNFVAANQTFGVRQTADGLEKLTWGLVAFILVCSIASNFVKGSSKVSPVDAASKSEAMQQVLGGQTEGSGFNQPTETTLPIEEAEAEEL